MNYIKAELFRLTRSRFGRNAWIYTLVAGLVVFLFRYYSPAINLYREPNGFGLFSYGIRALSFLWVLFLIFFLSQQNQLENEEGLVRQILTTSLSRGQFARQRWLVSWIFWGAGFVSLFLFFLLLSGLFTGFPQIAEQDYIFYTKTGMFTFVFLSFLGMLIVLFVIIGLFNVMFLLFGNMGFLPAILLLLALFFVPGYDFLEYFLPGIHLVILPDILEKMSQKLPIAFSSLAVRFFVNQIIWLVIVYFVQLKIIENRDFAA